MKINGRAVIPVLFSTLMSFTVAHDIIIRGDQWKTLTKGSEFPVLRENDRWVPGEVDKVVEKLDWYKFTVTDEIRSAALKGKGRGSTSTSQQLETLPLQMYRNKKVTCIRIWNEGKTQHTYYVTDSSKLKRALINKTPVKPRLHAALPGGDVVADGELVQACTSPTRSCSSASRCKPVPACQGVIHWRAGTGLHLLAKEWLLGGLACTSSPRSYPLASRYRLAPARRGIAPRRAGTSLDQVAGGNDVAPGKTAH
ncbi:hypothetical protein PCANC_15324 [Puccinia coronata f. sp. avenae]|uniref:Uncharacterized protein n=1 Tax=Puccinia coronata f. sp. avenae TaxID=200324 RepID=A0A2N5SXB7_9BASI|nr:hypothetical protein PCANC_15324 [Puccinia coronata f. sp. avenae]